MPLQREENGTQSPPEHRKLSAVQAVVEPRVSNTGVHDYIYVFKQCKSAEAFLHVYTCKVL